MRQSERRKFFKVCGSFLAALAGSRPIISAAVIDSEPRNRVQLQRNGKPVTPDDLEVGQMYIFNYPYITTPCMLVDLGHRIDREYRLTTENGSRYTWPGGVGPSRSIVAYSAICAHKMTYPAKSTSFLNYRHSKVVYFDKDSNRQEREQIIYCCSERSVYDPSKGAQVIGGPAPQPLATVLIDYKEDDNTLHAVGTVGGNLFDNFLKEFEFRLRLDFEVANVRKPTVDEVEILTIEEYSKTIVHC